MENDEYFICIKCGNRYLKTDLLVHDARCKRKYNYFSQKTNNFLYNNNNDIFKCHICGVEMKLEEKMDHLLCHELENNDIRGNQNTYRNNNNIDRNINGNYNMNRNINNNRIDNLADILNNLHFNNNRNRINNERGNSISYSRRNDASSFALSDSNENKRLDNKTIERFPISKIKDVNKLDEEKKKCLICLDNFKIGDNTIILPCIHIFHSDCIKNGWKKRIYAHFANIKLILLNK